MKDIMFVIMLASLVNFLAGSIMGPSSDLEEARGFVGFSGMIPIMYNIHLTIE